MGGAGVIRSAAARVAGFGVFNRGPSVVPSTPATEKFYPAPRSSTCSASSILSSSSAEADASFVQLPPWNASEWDADEMNSDADCYQFPRLVFGGPPSLEEAKSATADLEVALDNVSTSDSQDSLSFSAHNQIALLPNPAFQALKLLKENYAAQTVVASLASDPNVWDAFMRNAALTEFLEMQKTRSMNEEVKAECCVDANEGSVRGIVDGLIGRVKKSIVEMASFVSDLLGWKSDEEGSMGVSIGRSFFALAMMVIVMVLLKRV